MRQALETRPASRPGPQPSPEREARPPELVLGTAQLGMPYGVANRLGRPGGQEARAIVGLAWAAGIRCFDTAQHYGDSEQVLGEALARLGAGLQARVVTKLAPELDPGDGPALAAALEQSRRRLGQDQLWGCLLHRAAWLDNWGQGPEANLRRAVESGAVAHLGISVYDKAEVRRALKIAALELIQAPLNAWSMDPEWEELLEAAGQRGRRVHLRSVYLQGLLLMEPEAAAARLPQAGPALRRWRGLAAELGCAPAELALRFVSGLGLPLVVGLESAEQLRENLSLAQAPPLGPAQRAWVMKEMRPLVDRQLIDPRRWPAA